MPRVHLIEIHDQDWCPRVLRDAATDYLQFVTRVSNPYAPVVDRLRQAIERAGAARVVDLCSGAGGPWPELQPLLSEGGAAPLPVLLTDRFPNLAACERVRDWSGGVVTYGADPVDASRTPAGLDGFRTLFASFHHFRPNEARRILEDAVARCQGIGVFEMTHRSIPAVALMCLVPLLVVLSAPFVRPFRWTRLFWTYLVPVLPLLIFFDGVISCLRTYAPDELADLVEGLDDYHWDIGEDRSGPGPVPVTYLIGYPIEARR